MRVDLKSFTTKRGQMAKGQLFQVDLVSRFGVMLQETMEKLEKFEASFHEGKRWHHLNFLVLGT